MENKKSICDAKGCTQKATTKFGPYKICVDCFSKVAYDMQTLAMKGTQDANKR